MTKSIPSCSIRCIFVLWNVICLQDGADAGKKLDSRSNDSSSPTMSVAKVQLQKRSLSSHHLITSTSSPVEADPRLIVVKPEVNSGGSVMSVSPVNSTFTYTEGHCTDSMSQNVEDIAVKSEFSGGSQSSLFSCSWIDGKGSMAEREMVTVKPEPSVDVGRQVRQYEDFVLQDLELPRFVESRDQYLGHSGSFESQNCMNDVCLSSTTSGQQHSDGRVNNVDMMATDMSMDSMKQQQILVDDSFSDFGFNANTSPLISSQSMPLLPTYKVSEVLKDPTAGYRMPGTFNDKSQSFVDPSFSHSGSALIGYSGVVQRDILANEPPESGYGRCFSYTDHGPHEVMHFQNSDQQRNNQSDGYFSSVPRTPTLYTAVGPKPMSQQSGHRTPRTPYTPSTPGRSGHFQFPSITEGAVVGNCQHRYQKSTAYHPYGHQHTPVHAQQLTTLGPDSPRYLNQCHTASIAHEINQQQFRHDVAHAQQEIEQRLQQLQHEDKIKQMMMTQQADTDAAFSAGTGAHCQPTATTNSMSADTSVGSETASHGSRDIPTLSPVDEVLQLIMPDAPAGITTDTGSVASAVPLLTTELQSRSVSIHGTSAYPHSASDSLLSQLTLSNLVYDQSEMKKLRRKHKPEPLFIPPDVNNFGSGALSMQWSSTGSERCKAQFPPHSSAAVMSPRMGVASGTHSIQRPQQINHFGEPRSAPPFHWSSANMCKLIMSCYFSSFNECKIHREYSISFWYLLAASVL